jgi:hypothetical protein
VVLPGEGSAGAFRGTAVAPVIMRSHSCEVFSFVTQFALSVENSLGTKPHLYSQKRSRQNELQPICASIRTEDRLANGVKCASLAYINRLATETQSRITTEWI